MSSFESWSRESVAWVCARPSRSTRIAAWLVLGLVLMAIVIVLLPLALFVVAMAVAGLLIRTALGLGERLTRPNGLLDGRRNVRVISPADPDRR
jgi:hypothetical protein